MDSTALAEDRTVGFPKNKFFTSCCVIVDPPRMRLPSKSPSAAISYGVPIESMVLVETRILGGDDRMLTKNPGEIWLSGTNSYRSRYGVW